MLREPFRHPLDVPGVRRIAAEAGNTQHIEQLRFERFTIGARIGARGVTGWRHARSSLFLHLMNDSLLCCLANEEYRNRGTFEQIFRDAAKKPAPQSRF